MKQRKFGKKIQNWHRSLGPNELSHRYRKKRHSFSEEEYWDDGDWDHEDPYWDVYDADVPEVTAYNLEQSLRQVLVDLKAPDRPLFQVDWVAAIASDRAADSESPAELREPDSSPIERRLAKHIQNMLHFARNPDALRSAISQSVSDASALDVLSSLRTESALPNRRCQNSNLACTEEFTDQRVH